MKLDPKAQKRLEDAITDGISRTDAIGRFGISDTEYNATLLRMGRGRKGGYEWARYPLRRANRCTKRRSCAICSKAIEHGQLFFALETNGSRIAAHQTCAKIPGNEIWKEKLCRR